MSAVEEATGSPGLRPLELVYAEVDAVFQACDRNADGRVSKRALKSTLKANETLLRRLKLKRLKDVHEFIDRFDADGDKGTGAERRHARGRRACARPRSDNRRRPSTTA